MNKYLIKLRRNSPGDAYLHDKLIIDADFYCVANQNELHLFLGQRRRQDTWSLVATYNDFASVEQIRPSEQERYEGIVRELQGKVGAQWKVINDLSSQLREVNDKMKAMKKAARATKHTTVIKFGAQVKSAKGAVKKSLKVAKKSAISRVRVRKGIKS
jgi:uncharacterized coiled-coil protein SlyX